MALWCEEKGLKALPATPESIAVFLRREAETKSVATVRRRAATISRLHKAAGVENPCEHELVKLALKGIAKTKGTDQRQAAPLSGRDAVTICARSGDRLIDARNLALLLVGRDLLARSSELVAIQTGDIEWDEDGALIRVRRRKTSTETRTYYIGPEASQALKAWLERAEITEGPVFRSVSPGGNVKPSVLDTRDVRRTLKGLAERANIPHAESVSGHSLRVGMAQDLVAADLDIAGIMQAGGWASPTMVARYSEKITARRGAIARYYNR